MVKYFENFGITVREGYGITECSPIIACNRLDKYKPGSVGVKGPDAYCQVSVIEGEICVRGDIVFKGYYKDEKATGMVLYDGWFHTGDLGYIDEDGYIYVTGRKKNLIILADGNNVGPEEIERYFYNYRLIKSMFVSAKTYNQKMYITAFVYPDYEYAAELGIEDVQEKIKEKVREINVKLPAYKKIQRTEFSNEDFEKTELGKIRRFKY